METRRIAAQDLDKTRSMCSIWAPSSPLSRKEPLFIFCLSGFWERRGPASQAQGNRLALSKNPSKQSRVREQTQSKQILHQTAIKRFAANPGRPRDTRTVTHQDVSWYRYSMIGSIGLAHEIANTRKKWNRQNHTLRLRT